MVNKEEFAALEKRVATMETQIKELLEVNKSKETQISNLEKNIKDLQASGNNLSPTATSEIWNTYPKHIPAVISKLIKTEKFLNKKKENNIIIVGMKEPNKENEDENKEEDLREINKMLEKLFIKHKEKDNTVTKIVTLNINNITRFKSKTVGKVGNVKIEFKDIEEKKSIIRTAKYLKEMEDYKNVYINSDLTESEMVNERRLRRDRAEKNKLLKETDNGTGQKYGLYKFPGDEEETPYYWGIKNGVVTQKKRNQTNK